MFSYTAVSDRVKEVMRNLDLLDYVKVLYNDPNPILKDYNPEPCMVVGRFKEYAQEIKDFPIHKTDAWLLGYGKTGTTLLCELVAVLRHNLDFEKIAQLRPIEKAAFFEFFFVSRVNQQGLLDGSESMSPNGRTIRTHFPLNLLPDGLFRSSNHKMIYIARNPKDAAVSLFYYFPQAHLFQFSLKDFLDCYLKGDIVWGSCFQHISEHLRLAKVVKNLLVITYEELTTNPIPVIKRVAEFLDKPITDKDAAKVANFIHFDEMKNRSKSNMVEEITGLNENVENWDKDNFKFLRKGKTNSYTEIMPEEYVEKFNEEMRKWPEIMELYPNY